MENPAGSLQIKNLHYSPKPEDYFLYKAALEWDLVAPIVIENRGDLKSEYLWKDKVEPYNHQVKNLITFCRRLPVTLLADDVGLGKTISAGLVASELISRGRLSKILIVCPKILREQWKEELETKFGIDSIIVTGKELTTAQPPNGVGAVITTYRSATIYLDQIKDVGFEMLILDEAHKLRNLYGTDIAPQVAQRFKKALTDRLFKYVLMLTATPIQNRLWDLYSLVDLLTVARGHENPFGNPGMFARKFIGDNRIQARQLKPEMQDEFRSIVYGYMSRIRRDDANLHFPQREVQLHTVQPTKEEIELINIIGRSIEKLDRLTQIGILKTLVSSPEALVTQLNGMAKRNTIPETLAKDVRDVVERISLTAKLQGLGALVDKLKSENPGQWRMVVFTTRLETQTTIQSFLEDRGIVCGLINGSSGSSNQETIAKFKKNDPEINVIVSTEAGSEGVNLQAANVLVNYDLPWNPMIVEQRIGRIQRLGSKHEKVCIFNIVLQGTFEEYIVGRLIEKLQMASSAIGDIESLLQASGIEDGEDDDLGGFEQKILQLVLASMKGKDVEEATRKIKTSIDAAKIQLESEKENIDVMLGGMDNESEGPKCPKLPSVVQSVDVRTFVLSGLTSLGAQLTLQTPDTYISDFEGKKELICFEKDNASSEETLFSTTLYSPGSTAFERLVGKLTSKGLQRVQDGDQNTLSKIEKTASNWVASFGGSYDGMEVKEIKKSFSGTALVRVRITVTHDSYERLVEVICSPEENFAPTSKNDLEDPIDSLISNPTSIGINSDYLVEKAKSDSGVSEFCRFYQERLIEELRATGSDLRKRKRLEDEFTPRLTFALVGLEGFVRRQVGLSVLYELESNFVYKSKLAIIPSVGEITDSPKLSKCAYTDKLVPQDCLAKCEISGHDVLRHLLVKSEISGRMALPEYIVICSLSGKHVLKDEAEKSVISGNFVIPALLKTSAISAKRAEPEFFDRCDFTSSEVLKSELLVSQVSGKQYRMDEQLRSVVSGKTGHRQEFIFCSETNKPLLPDEAEKCEITGKIVAPGILELCEITNKKVLSTELEKSTVSGKQALKKYFVSSNLSGARLLEEEAVKSITGKFCVPLEAKICAWSGKKCHPEDLRSCELTGLPIYFGYVTVKDQKNRLEPLSNLLDGVSRKTDRVNSWVDVVDSVGSILGNRACVVEGSEISPNEQVLAVCIKVKTLLGLKVRQAGLLYSLTEKSVIGRIAMGRRESTGWIWS